MFCLIKNPFFCKAKNLVSLKLMARFKKYTLAPVSASKNLYKFTWDGQECNLSQIGILQYDELLFTIINYVFMININYLFIRNTYFEVTLVQLHYFCESFHHIVTNNRHIAWFEMIIDAHSNRSSITLKQPHH